MASGLLVDAKTVPSAEADSASPLATRHLRAGLFRFRRCAARGAVCPTGRALRRVFI